MADLCEALLNFIFPPHCPLCHKYVEQRGDWCVLCLRRACRPQRLAVPAPVYFFVEETWAISEYREGTQELIRRLKYHGQRGTLPYIRTLLREAEKNPEIRQLLTESDYAAAVPLHEERQRRRGFNQAELIFGDWLQMHAVPLLRPLRRVRGTKPMYELTQKERQENLAGAFAAVKPPEIEGKHILLVDDILTTGATLCACAELLRAAGAAAVKGLVLASDHR